MRQSNWRIQHINFYILYILILILHSILHFIAEYELSLIELLPFDSLCVSVCVLLCVSVRFLHFNKYVPKYNNSLVAAIDQ